MAIVGIDEVGRGAWAGPLVVGAVLLGGAAIDGMTDSKLLSKKQREALDGEIRRSAVSIGLGWVSAKDIDVIGLSRALKLAARRAVAHIRGEYDEIIIDGTMRLIDDPRVTLLKKADLLVPSVSAASIIAKVARDNYMKHVDTIFPGYTFHRHVGYGTAGHRSAIKTLGVTPLHRLSYLPLSGYRAGDTFEPAVANKATLPTSKQIGDRAENEVANYLTRRGHTVVERNWKTKYCEIDIISVKNKTMYFTEVKYRKTDSRGDGLAAVTPRKQRQMSFAAEYYTTASKLPCTDICLNVADVTGTPPQVVTVVAL